MPDANSAETPPLTIDDLCRFLEAWRGTLTLESVLRRGFVGTKITIRLQPPYGKPVVHEALRPDEQFSGRALPSFASELEQMMHHLRLAYPALDQAIGSR